MMKPLGSKKGTCAISQFPLWHVWQRCQQAGKPKPGKPPLKLHKFWGLEVYFKSISCLQQYLLPMIIWSTTD